MLFKISFHSAYSYISVILWLSILLKSNVELISCTKNSPDVFILPRYSFFSSMLLLSIARLVKPITPLSGVLISWLIFDKKTVLASFAFFASSRASESIFSFFCSSCTVAVTSFLAIITRLCALSSHLMLIL